MYSSLGGGGRGRTCVFAGIPAGCYRYTTLPVGAFRAAPDPWSDLGGLLNYRVEQGAESLDVLKHL